MKERELVDLAALRILDARCAPAPWRQGNVEKHHVFAPFDRGIGPERVVLRMNDNSDEWDWSSEAALIVALRNSLDPLADELEALRFERERAIDVARRCLVMAAAASDRADAEAKIRAYVARLEFREVTEP